MAKEYRTIKPSAGKTSVARSKIRSAVKKSAGSAKATKSSSSGRKAVSASKQLSTGKLVRKDAIAPGAYVSQRSVIRPSLNTTMQAE